MSEGISPAVVDRLRVAIEDEHGLLSWLGTTVERVEQGTVVLSVPFDEKLTNATEPSTVHGGVAATLADTAGALAIRSTFDDPETGGMATINLAVNYLEPAHGGLTATAETVRVGGSVGVSEIRITSGDDSQPVGLAQGSYRLFRDGRASEFQPERDR
mgnify:CR=1 FL=1